VLPSQLLRRNTPPPQWYLDLELERDWWNFELGQPLDLLYPPDYFSPSSTPSLDYSLENGRESRLSNMSAAKAGGDGAGGRTPKITDEDVRSQPHLSGKYDVGEVGLLSEAADCDLMAMIKFYCHGGIPQKIIDLIALNLTSEQRVLAFGKDICDGKKLADVYPGTQPLKYRVGPMPALSKIDALEGPNFFKSPEVPDDIRVFVRGLRLPHTLTGLPLKNRAFSPSIFQRHKHGEATGDGESATTAEKSESEILLDLSNEDEIKNRNIKEKRNGTIEDEEDVPEHIKEGQMLRNILLQCKPEGESLASYAATMKQSLLDRRYGYTVDPCEIPAAAHQQQQTEQQKQSSGEQQQQKMPQQHKQQQKEKMTQNVFFSARLSGAEASGILSDKGLYGRMQGDRVVEQKVRGRSGSRGKTSNVNNGKKRGNSVTTDNLSYDNGVGQNSEVGNSCGSNTAYQQQPASFDQKHQPSSPSQQQQPTETGEPIDLSNLRDFERNLNGSGERAGVQAEQGIPTQERVGRDEEASKRVYACVINHVQRYTGVYDHAFEEYLDIHSNMYGVDLFGVYADACAYRRERQRQVDEQKNTGVRNQQNAGSYAQATANGNSRSSSNFQQQQQFMPPNYEQPPPGYPPFSNSSSSGSNANNQQQQNQNSNNSCNNNNNGGFSQQPNNNNNNGGFSQQPNNNDNSSFAQQQNSSSSSNSNSFKGFAPKVSNKTDIPVFTGNGGTTKQQAIQFLIQFLNMIESFDWHKNPAQFNAYCCMAFAPPKSGVSDAYNWFATEKYKFMNASTVDLERFKSAFLSQFISAVYEADLKSVFDSEKPVKGQSGKLFAIHMKRFADTLVKSLSLQELELQILKHLPTMYTQQVFGGAGAARCLLWDDFLAQMETVDLILSRPNVMADAVSKQQVAGVGNEGTVGNQGQFKCDFHPLANSHNTVDCFKLKKVVKDPKNVNVFLDNGYSISNNNNAQVPESSSFAAAGAAPQQTRQQFQSRQQQQPNRSSTRCYRCNQSGHFARDCPTNSQGKQNVDNGRDRRQGEGQQEKWCSKCKANSHWTYFCWKDPEGAHYRPNWKPRGPAGNKPTGNK
jgi:Zinc knuckle